MGLGEVIGDGLLNPAAVPQPPNLEGVVCERSARLMTGTQHGHVVIGDGHINPAAVPTQNLEDGVCARSAHPMTGTTHRHAVMGDGRINPAAEPSRPYRAMDYSQQGVVDDYFDLGEGGAGGTGLRHHRARSWAVAVQGQDAPASLGGWRLGPGQCCKLGHGGAAGARLSVVAASGV